MSHIWKLSGHLDQPTHSIEIRCLPTDVPKVIEVDVSLLNVGDHLRISDLIIDREKIEVLADDEQVVVSLAAPRIVEEEVPVLEEPAEPEVIKKGKTDEEAEQ